MDNYWVSWFMMVCIGAAAGWSAGLILHGKGLGILGNVLVGILGAYFGRWLFGILHIPPLSDWSYMGEFIYGFVGAMILLLVFGRLFIQPDNL